ncbi:GNAT family N-acetyltransferase [Kordia jejudonensis]|uniref:GNAT family N-acetyltransferase n=1 Tax=Kordia jejudonensis TaxID=1348245 RepID=UPI000628FB74|nr:GNAT family N-acetyltransferase [Kordia jejudonensis]
MKTILETNRLRLREFVSEDSEFIMQLVNTPLWIQFIGDRNIKTLGVAEEYIQENLRVGYSKNGFGLWCMELKTSSTPIGMCGLVKRKSLENVDIGFALLPDYERQGYTFEAAKATMKYAKDRLKIKKIVAITDPKNVASIGLLNKIGLRFEKELQLSEGDTVLLFS